MNPNYTKVGWMEQFLQFPLAFLDYTPNQIQDVVMLICDIVKKINKTLPLTVEAHWTFYLNQMRHIVQSTQQHHQVLDKLIGYLDSILITVDSSATQEEFLVPVINRGNMLIDKNKALGNTPSTKKKPKPTIAPVVAQTMSLDEIMNTFLMNAPIPNAWLDLADPESTSPTPSS